jgi:hypothetical protein
VLEAGAQAARLRRLASAQTATICETAEREAEIVWRQASAQATAIREAAEREAAELRAAVMKLSAGPSELVYADGDVASMVKQISRPDDGPAATPQWRPAAKPGALGKANTRGRQVRAMRRVAAAFLVLSLAGVTNGAVELKLHGLSFFLFRNAAAGAGNSSNLNENQGPGLPDAPKPHHQAVTPGTRDKPTPTGRHVKRPSSW